MNINLIESLIFRRFRNNSRFTQDSPVYPDVWLDYFKNATKLKTYRCDLIFTPHRNSTAAELVQILYERFSKSSKTGENKNSDWALATTGESVAVKVTLDELINEILPLTDWWKREMKALDKSVSPTMIWLQEMIGAMIFFSLKKNSRDTRIFETEASRKVFRNLFIKSKYHNPDPAIAQQPTVIFSVSKNRQAVISIDRSVPATKADASRRVFDIDGSGITWAVFDTGIDARHPAFRKIDPKTKLPFEHDMESAEKGNANNTRVAATYDFTRFREIMSGSATGSKKMAGMVSSDKHNKKLSVVEMNNLLTEMGKDLRTGRLLDWTVIAPLIRIPHNKTEYKPPVHSHGTHVAGILGASTFDEKGQPDLQGMCPKITLYDIRVLDDQGFGDEFNILAALQFIRWMNTQRDGIVVHGINLSLSMKHEVSSFGCGQTPVCVSCERLVAEGTVVVAAAGNLGQAMFQDTQGGSEQGFRMVNITDPGNAETVITVGSTHSNRPHSYGVSYFSSKGPTGDGRLKPDLVAPGEKIESTSVNGGLEVRDGTSMATPHVSGAAALLLAKHRELIGKPTRVKEILCKTATDLRRERYFQGSGMLDVLRAIQSV